jgi:uncharacterized membrane protein YoaK (UPF0700 family)
MRLSHPGRRHALVVILTFVTGAADAIGFLALGGAFSSVMTGNMVLLGLSIASANWTQVIHVGIAVLCFIAGVTVGAHIAGRPQAEDGVWPKRVTVALLVEGLLFLALLVMWEATLGGRSQTAQEIMLAMSALALGIQSSAVQRFGVSGLSSTYLTGTLTTMVGGFAARKPFIHQLPSLLVLLTLVVGAAIGCLGVLYLPPFAPFIVVLPLAAVIVMALLLQWPEKAGDERAPAASSSAA